MVREGATDVNGSDGGLRARGSQETRVGLRERGGRRWSRTRTSGRE
ncbi:hypothetical protein STRIP9103_09181 [Streptomyces ipomoeae 91-03]|uniref:Uncharacterized protein n=1 Tax=Streptomyces ipomoeae 91-03 TaxID=698759 RepID=L1KLP4_9ACTN|nr:hypothetical protein STRIP9103_09181 [Streptomyces ipomoeae 91-03]